MGTICRENLEILIGMIPSVSTDESRQAICHVQMTRDYAYATDGDIAVRRALHKDDFLKLGESIYFTPDILKAIKKACGKNLMHLTYENGKVSLPGFSWELPVVNYPKVDEFFKVRHAVPLTITLDPELLLAAAKSLHGSRSRNYGVQITFDGMSDKPYSLRTISGGGDGIIMPMRNPEAVTRNQCALRKDEAVAHGL